MLLLQLIAPCAVDPAAVRAAGLHQLQVLDVHANLLDDVDMLLYLSDCVSLASIKLSDNPLGCRKVYQPQARFAVAMLKHGADSLANISGTSLTIKCVILTLYRLSAPSSDVLQMLLSYGPTGCCCPSAGPGTTPWYCAAVPLPVHLYTCRHQDTWCGDRHV